LGDPSQNYASLGARVIINQGRVRRRRKNTYYTYVDTKLSDIYIFFLALGGY
jgi:hypothetical protein